MFIVALSLLSGCKEAPPDETDTDVPVAPPAPGDGFLTGEFCLVRTVFEVSCVTGCHSSVVVGGGLDLQTSPYAALINRPAQAGGQILVAPDDSLNSFLYRKMTGLLAEGEGGVMPPDGALEPFVAQLVADWIDNGAPNDCDIVPPGEGPPPPPPPPPPIENPDEPYHPVGWAAADQHGVGANLQSGGDCRSCHGEQLDGGDAGQPSCDSCHTPGWRTNCTYCHGGEIDTSGAPPKDVDGIVNPNLISFMSHSAHIAQGYSCEQCHYKPTDYLTNGHVFGDVTPGYGEIDYTAGYSPIATYSAGTCSNAYCHGAGLADDGVVSDGDGPLGCSSCHPNAGDAGLWNQMSGRHELHLSEGAVCYECHANTVDADNAIVGQQYHVNREKDVFSNELDAGATCTGTCHNHNHDGDNW